MKRMLLFPVIALMGCLLTAQTGIPVPQMSSCDSQIQNFMTTYDIPSLTMALAKDGELKYLRSFGNADIAATQPTQPYHMFRIASVSKPITGIGIMKMVEDGEISLSDTVFGPGGILENHWYFSNSNIVDNRVYNITVQELLEHSAGWDRNVNCFPNPTTPYPWFFSGCDPIVAPLHVTQTQGEQNPVKEEFLINYLLEKNLNFTPGTASAYSNMGFLVLSEIIEEVSGKSYEEWMQDEILHPLGIFDMYIAENLQEDKKEREGEYVGNGFTTLDLYGSGNLVPWEYGGMAVDAMDGHGGWIGSAKDLVRLLVAVDGFNTKPDILLPGTITTMTTPSVNDPFYAKGWQVNGANNWWHTGAIDGTASIWVRSNNGYTWAIVLNKRVVDGTAVNFWNALDGMGWNCISGASGFPAFDLFEAPTVPASGLVASGDGVSTIELNWSNGNGASRLVVAKDITNNTDPYNFSAYPLDGQEYASNSQFGSGANLGDDTFVIYNGSGSDVLVTGLDNTRKYAFRVYEYTSNSANGNNEMYLLGNPAEREAFLSIDENELRDRIIVYPTLTTGDLFVDIEFNADFDMNIFDLQGRIVQNAQLKGGLNSLDVSSLKSGMYMMEISNEYGSIVKRFVKR